MKNLIVLGAALFMGACQLPESSEIRITRPGDTHAPDGGADGSSPARGDALSWGDADETTRADADTDTDAGSPGGDAMTAPDIAPPDRRPDSGMIVHEPPAATWNEHWFEHDQLLTMAGQDEHAAVYLDDGVTRADAQWLILFFSKLWAYTKRTYGVPGDPRLYAILHEGRYLGGHTASVFDASHDSRNVLDFGVRAGGWRDVNAVGLPILASGAVLEGASLGVEGVPAGGLTGREFAQIYVYDALNALGMADAANRHLANANQSTTNSPRPQTYWFRDWYYPLWKRGGAALFARYFQLLSKHFPQVPRPQGPGFRYERAMNEGEYVHFMSGAAGMDLRAMATTAFGWTLAEQLRFIRAKTDFPAIVY